MKLHNYDVQPLMQFILNELKLKGKQSRMRMRLYKLLEEQLKQMKEEQRLLLQEQNALDENGEIKFKEDQQTPDVANLNQYEKDLNDLFSEEFHIEENENNKEMLITVRDALLDFDGELSGQNAINHNAYCEMFEQLSYDEE